jgi:hypothetical protein
MMASLENLQVLNSGRFSSSFEGGFSARISVYLLRGRVGSAFLLLTVGRTDLNQLRLRGDSFGDVRVYL